jgi:hypothetical protein
MSRHLTLDWWLSKLNVGSCRHTHLRTREEYKDLKQRLENNELG